MTTKQYLTVNEISKLLKVARYRVYEWVKADQIPYLRTVGRILFDPGEIEQWLRRERMGKGIEAGEKLSPADDLDYNASRGV